MEPIIDIVTVLHNETNYKQTQELFSYLEELEGDRLNFLPHDNREVNLGFAAACNYAASFGEAPIIGFINPDIYIGGPFVDIILPGFQPAWENDCPVIVGTPFGKHPREWCDTWRCDAWVCGAFMFVRRDWFESVDGFDKQFVWSWEETDLIRTAQLQGKRVVMLRIHDGYISHSSPTDDSEVDSEYKRFHFENGAKLYRKKWMQWKQ